MGLRELKKNQTRKSISDIAMKLFIASGYDEVTTAEIAERAEVSVPTLFNYFPTKESLVFDEDNEKEAELVDAVVNRRKGQGILDALLEAGIKNMEYPENDKKLIKNFIALVERTPQLSLYARQMWLRHEKTLAKVIRKEVRNKLGAMEAEVIARFVLDAYYRAMSAPQPKATLRDLFRILREGWSG